MGFQLCAFLGRYSDLRSWEGQLKAAVTCELSGELGMVPVTGQLWGELRARLGDEHLTGWGREASHDTVIAYVSVGEFGNQSHDEATLWSNGRAIFREGTVEQVLAYFRDTAGLRTDAKVSDLEWFRGDLAAEKWEAAARLKRESGGTR